MFQLLLLTRRSVQRRPLYLYQYHTHHRSFHSSLRTYTSTSASQEQEETQPGIHRRTYRHDDAPFAFNSPSVLIQDGIPSTTPDLECKDERPQSDHRLETEQSLYKGAPSPAVTHKSSQTKLWTQETLDKWRAVQRAGKGSKMDAKNIRRRALAEAKRTWTEPGPVPRGEEMAQWQEAQAEAFKADMEAKERFVEEAIEAAKQEPYLKSDPKNAVRRARKRAMRAAEISQTPEPALQAKIEASRKRLIEEAAEEGLDLAFDAKNIKKRARKMGKRSSLDLVARQLEADTQALQAEVAKLSRRQSVAARREEARRIAGMKKEQRMDTIAMKKEEKKAQQEAKKKEKQSVISPEDKAKREKCAEKKKSKKLKDAIMGADAPPKDVTEYLTWAFKRAESAGRKADKRRINITNQDLADDALERLKPSLDKHMGCDIIDINPGTGIWSATIHDYLKPRKHILIEPDTDVYTPRLKALLDAPDSKYALVPKSGIVWRHLEEILTETHLPFQESLKPGDPRLEQPNNTLLLVASLGFHPRLRFRGFASFSQLIIHQLVGSIRTQTLLQKYGQVRMLIWIGDVEARRVIPKTLSHRRPSSIEAEIYSDVSEIASSTALSARLDSGFTASNTLEVLDRMTAAGITVPLERESDAMQLVKSGVPDALGDNRRRRRRERKNIESEEGFTDEPVEGVEKWTPGVMNKNMLNHTFHARLNSLEEDFQNGGFEEKIELPKNLEVEHENTERLLWTPEYGLLQLLRRQHRSGRILLPSRQDMVEELVTLMGLERQSFLLPQGASRQKAINKITAKGAAILDRVDNLPEYAIEDLLYFIDTFQSGISTPPFLLWDRRQVEPLKVRPDEFVPAQEMTLLDIQPKPLWPILRENYPENMETFDFILGNLMTTPSQPLKKGFDALAPGAFEWMVDHCPLLTDPTQGGSYHPATLRVRMLTPGMLKQIIEAWMTWPFRPSRYELIARSGSDIHDPANAEDEL